MAKEFRRISNFKPIIFVFYFNSSGHLDHRSKTILAIFAESHLSNISVKFEGNWFRGVEEFSLKHSFLFLAFSLPSRLSKRF